MSNTSTTFRHGAAPVSPGCSRRIEEDDRTMAKHSRTLALLASAAVLAAACTGGGGTAAPTVSTAPAPSGPVASASPGALPTPEKTDIKMGLSVTETSQFAAQLAV